MGFNPGTPGPRPGPKAGAKPLSHPGIPYISLSNVELEIASVNTCEPRLDFLGRSEEGGGDSGVMAGWGLAHALYSVPFCSS